MSSKIKIEFFMFWSFILSCGWNYSEIMEALAHVNISSDWVYGVRHQNG